MKSKHKKTSQEITKLLTENGIQKEKLKSTTDMKQNLSYQNVLLQRKLDRWSDKKKVHCESEIRKNINS